MAANPPADSFLPQTCKVLTTSMAMIDYQGAVILTQQWAKDRSRPYAVSATNTHGIALARHDPQFHACLARFDLNCPDGMNIVRYMNWKTRRPPMEVEPLKDRVYGPTLMLHCLEQSGDEFSHFFLGGSEEVLAELKRKLQARFPRLRVAGTYSPPFGQWSQEENERIFEAIRASEADYIWVGLGCPKQESWIGSNKDRLPPGVYVAVGAAFAFHAGRTRQAPMWVQSNGLEWAYRILTEPRRLFKRYATYISLLLFYLVWDGLKGCSGGCACRPEK